MNGLFRSARRTLSWGLLAAVSLVGVVVAKGIHPEVLVAFKPSSDATLLAQADEPTSARAAPPEHFAQAESDSRLDVAQGIRSALNGPNSSQKVLGRPSSPQESKHSITEPQSGNSESLELPPHPDTPTATETSVGPEQPEQGPVFELPPPPETDDTENTELAQAMPHAKAVESTAPSKASTSSGLEKSSPQAEPKFIEKLTALQEQLDRIAATQEQHRATQQSWLESHYQQHQQQLERKLEGIEAGLRDLQAKSEQLAAASKSSVERTAPSGSFIRQDRAGTTSPGQESRAPALVRDVLDSLAEKSNLNLTLSINVEGDVEMSVPEIPLRESSGTVRRTPGYVVEKDGRKVQIAPLPPQQYQREAFLPPIIKDAAP